jgi:hypothetical protein
LERTAAGLKSASDPIYANKQFDFVVVSLYLLLISSSVGRFCFLIGEDMAAKRSKRREWTKTDIRELKTLAREKTPAPRIARKLKRTEGATRQKAFSLGVSLDSRA